jgi:hypothetical protein
MNVYNKSRDMRDARVVDHDVNGAFYLGVAEDGAT